MISAIVGNNLGNYHMFLISSKKIAMNNTEFFTVAAPQPATAASAIEDRDGVSSPHDIDDELTDRGGTEQELAPVDGGLAAWKMLFAAFMFETLLWGESRLYIAVVICMRLIEIINRIPPFIRCLPGILL